MNLETVSDKHLHELERLARELIIAMQKAKLRQEPLIATLQELESAAAEARRERFDSFNHEYLGY